ATVFVGDHQLRVEAQRQAEIGDGAVIRALVGIGETTIVVSGGLLPVETERLVGGGDGEIVLALVEVGEGAVVVGDGIFRIESNRLIDIGKRDVIVAVFGVAEPAVTVSHREVGHAALAAQYDARAGSDAVWRTVAVARLPISRIVGAS